MTNNIAKIEDKIINKENLTDEEVTIFLDNIISNINNIIKDDTYINKCDTVQGLIGRYLDKLNITYYANITNKCISKDIVGHSFIVISFKDYNNDMYIIDPTFIQFLYLDNEYYDYYINNLRIKSKSPFYYAKNIDKDLTLELLQKGYLKLTSRSAYLYGNSFLLTKTNIKKDTKINLESGNTYINNFLKGKELLRDYNYPNIELKRR